MATLMAPLHKLLKRGEAWSWSEEHVAVFHEAKQRLMSSRVLVHFDPSLEIRLACDASDCGIGAVLSHRFPDGSERPVSFMSRTLNDAEKKCSQIEKEGLACVVGVTRFHSYLYCHHFVLQTDHKPLLTLFNEGKLVPQQASNRIQRWAWKLADYEYEMEFRTSKQHANADALSRLPLQEVPVLAPELPEVVLMIENLDNSPISAHDIANWTKRNPVLAQVYRFVQEGWPNTWAEELKPFKVRKDELSAQQGCIVWGDRVVIPPSAREPILSELHAGHPGVSRMKALARTFVWWPGVDQAITDRVQQCSACQLARDMQPKAPLQPWNWPSRPWGRIHIDFAGPVSDKMFLVVINAHSKWLDRWVCARRQLRCKLYVRFLLVLDYRSQWFRIMAQFVAAEFKAFCTANGIRHIRVAPYHPSSNGLAERAVRIFKIGLKKQVHGSLGDRLALALFEYRRTPQTTTGVSPAELMFGRPVRSRLSLIRPELQSKLREKQSQQKVAHDKAAKLRDYVEGEKVIVKMHKQDVWKPGKVVKKVAHLSFGIDLGNGQTRRCHVDQIRKNFLTASNVGDSQDESEAVVPGPLAQDRVSPDLSIADGAEGLEQHYQVPRYPSRTRHPPERLTV